MTVSIPSTTLEKFTTFGDLLRFLRRRAGLTQTELALAVGYGHTQISRLEQNLRLPDIPTIEARFVPALDLEHEPKVVARLLELAAHIRREDAPALGLCPYKGLNFFDEGDADLFVGREALTSKLVERLISLVSNRQQIQGRFLAIVGASGSGKSSLVRAGLVPALRWNEASTDWEIHVLTPTAQPLESLAISLTAENSSVATIANLMDDFVRDSRSLQIFVRRKLTFENGSRLLIVVDQFEELFALCRSEEERAAFIDNLLTAAMETDGSIILVITLRADFYAHCANYPGLREALAKHQEYIGAMDQEELRRAIEEPAQRGRWEFEPGLVDLLLHDVGHEPGALPLLSHALLETWQRRRGRTMTLSGYASSGGVRGAIAETAETVFADQFTQEQRTIARRIFLRLTELNDEASTADTRRRATFNELILKPEQAATTHAVLKTLADARLITTSEDSAEVAHEALIREWPTLRTWLEENREGLRLHRQLTEAAQDWLEMNRDPDLLYRGARLAQAREWTAVNSDELNALEHEFLNASIQWSERELAEKEAQRRREVEAAQSLAQAQRHRAEEQAHAARKLRKLAIYLAGALAVALIMASTALFFSLRSREATATALSQQQIATSRELASASVSSLEIDPERSILLALEALNAHQTVEAEGALHQALQASRIERVIQAHEPGAPMGVVLSPEESQFVTASAHGWIKTWDMQTGKELGRFKGIYATYSPDGKRLAIVLDNDTLNMIDPTTGKDILLPGEIHAEWIVAFSPDGSHLASIAENNTPKIWDLKTGRELIAFPGHSDLIGSVNFNADGTRLLTASDDHTARVWDAVTGEQLLTLSNHPSWVTGAKSSPDGKWIVTTSSNRAYLWDASSGEQLFTLSGHNNTILTTAFSPDGTRLATGSWDRKIIVWDLLSQEKLFTMSGHAGPVYAVAFTHDGQHLISSSDDGTVRFWNVGPSRELLTLTTQESNSRIAFSRDDSYIATVDEAAIKIWDAHSGREISTLSNAGIEVREFVFSHDGERIFTIGYDKTLKIWDTQTAEELAVIPAHASELSGMALSADGQRLATASHDHKVKIWDVSPESIRDEPLLTLDQPGMVFSVAFDPSGKTIAAGGQEGDTILWDLSTKKEIQILRGHSGVVAAVAFRPDGAHIATSSWDGTARVWNASTGEELFMLGSHTGAVPSIAYSPDGTRLATVSEDGTAKLWNAASGEELLTFTGDGFPLYDVVFSHNGNVLATGGVNGVRLYLLQIDNLIVLARSRLTRSLTTKECQQYLHVEECPVSP